MAIKQLITPIWRDLTDDSLLSKCLHGHTQNSNEALNGVIWKKCPKYIYVSKQILEIGVSSAVIEFNDGRSGLKSVIDQLGLPISQYMMNGFLERDIERIKKLARKSSEKGKTVRKKLRAIRKGFQDKEKEQGETPAYSSGAY